MQIVYGGRTDDLYALVSATPFSYEGSQLVLLVIEDIGQLAELQRIIPICMKCGKIRDDDQYWSRVEAYFHRHWDLQFSHGYCPQCLQEEMERLDKMDAKPNGGADGVARG